MAMASAASSSSSIGSLAHYSAEQLADLNADDFLVRKAPPTIYYLPNFIDEDQEAGLLARIDGAPKPKWQQLANRRLQNWGGIVGKKALIPDDDMPEWLQWCIDRITAVPFSFPQANRPNHVLINEYQPGQGIMPHTDGPAFFPTVSTISLGGHCLLDFYRRDIDTDQSADLSQRFVGSLLLEPRSLVLIKADAYAEMMHGIAERTEDALDEQCVFNFPADRFPANGGDLSLKREATRVSLTIRNVPKVSKLNLQGMLMGRTGAGS